MLGICSGISFATITFSGATPDNRLTTYNPRLSVNIADSGNNELTIVFQTNETGSWRTRGTYYGREGFYFQNTDNMQIPNGRYKWRIRVFDGNSWTERTYTFWVKAFVQKWTYNTGVGTTVGPLAADVNNDGIYEVFTTGDDEINAINGATGQVLWTYRHGEIRDHSPFEIGDLNNDGKPEIVISANSRTIALHANDGSVYWNVQKEGDDNYLIILDVDGNGFPYVFISSDDVFHGSEGTGRIRKLKGTTGAELDQVFAWRPCWGGLSAADANNDGKFEIYMCDRRAGYEPPPGGLGKGMQAYHAENLTLIWKEDDITCSSHTIALYDVNRDNILDSIAFQQGGGGIYVVNGATGRLMSGKYSNNLGLEGHSQFSIWDLDGDGALELITAKRSTAKVWDITNWRLEATIQGNFSEPPKIADLIGDSKLEIITPGRDMRILNNRYQDIEKIYGANGIASVLVQDIDKDGQNELVVVSYSGVVRAYDTSAYAPTPRVRTNNQYYSERRLGAAVYIPPPGAPQPFIKNEFPLQNAVNVNPNPKLSFFAVDYRHDRLDVKIEVYYLGSWVTVLQLRNVTNGVYEYQTSSFNIPGATYNWRATVTDAYSDGLTASKTFSFKIKN